MVETSLHDGGIGGLIGLYMVATSLCSGRIGGCNKALFGGGKSLRDGGTGGCNRSSCVVAASLCGDNIG